MDTVACRKDQLVQTLTHTHTKLGKKREQNSKKEIVKFNLTATLRELVKSEGARQSATCGFRVISGSLKFAIDNRKTI